MINLSIIPIVICGCVFFLRVRGREKKRLKNVCIYILHFIFKWLQEFINHKRHNGIALIENTDGPPKIRKLSTTPSRKQPLIVKIFGFSPSKFSALVASMPLTPPFSGPNIFFFSGFSDFSSPGIFFLWTFYPGFSLTNHKSYYNIATDYRRKTRQNCRLATLQSCSRDRVPVAAARALISLREQLFNVFFVLSPYRQCSIRRQSFRSCRINCFSSLITKKLISGRSLRRCSPFRVRFASRYGVRATTADKDQ